MKLMLIRHPALTEAARERCIGQTDVPTIPLTPDEATALEALAGRADRLASSDLVRCAGLATSMAAAKGLDCLMDRRLRELDFGEWDGKPWTDLERSDGARLGAWMNAFVRLAPPGGEAFADLAQRAYAWRDELAAAYPEETVCVFTHAGTIRSLVCDALGLPLGNAFRLRVDYLSVTSIEYRQSLPPSLLYLNAPLCVKL